jgi:WD40 repeat protein
MYIWEAHPNEVIWDIKHHRTDPYILSVGADEMVVLWKTPKQDEIEKLLEEEDDNKRLEDKLFVNNFEFNENQSSDTPI